MAKVKVLRESFINNELLTPRDGAPDIIVDFPDHLIARNADGTVNHSKHSALEFLEKPAPVKPQAAQLPKDADTGTDAGDDDGKPKAPTPEQRKESIKLAVDALDPANDAHWNKNDGKPSLKALAAITEFSVLREEVEAAAPDFVRPTE